MKHALNYLIFPGGMAESLAFKRTIDAMGHRVIGASSVASDPAIAVYDAWVFLPYIGTESFDDALVAALNAHAIDVLFTPHSVIAHHLERLIDAGKISVTLVVEPQARQATQAQLSIFTRIDHMMRFPLHLAIGGQAPALTNLQLATLIQHASNIVGSTSEEKLLAMAEIFRSCPKGDIVEIGTFWGRSAAILAVLATHFDRGPLLCIDPWHREETLQIGISQDVNHTARDLDFDAAFRGFLMGVAPYAAPGKINYLRTTSDLACDLYKHASTITSPELGASTYSKRIACLHIDGNHGLEAVTRDIDHWLPLVVAGGWVIVDDYQWAFGDGPKIAADRWMERHPERIARAFVIGSALFMRLL